MPTATATQIKTKPTMIFLGCADTPRARDCSSRSSRAILPEEAAAVTSGLALGSRASTPGMNSRLAHTAKRMPAEAMIPSWLAGTMTWVSRHISPAMVVRPVMAMGRTSSRSTSLASSPRVRVLPGVFISW